MTDQQAGPSPQKKETVSAVLDRNINALIRRRAEEESNLSRQERVAGAITDFAGSMAFVYLHAAIFGAWIIINLGLLPPIPVFDPSLVVLAMIASVEAIFISTFVLISQNRMAAEDGRRADLSLQISLLNEHETTRLIALVSAIAEKLEISSDVAPEEISEMTRNVPPEVVMEEIERQKRSEAGSPGE